MTPAARSRTSPYSPRKNHAVHGEKLPPSWRPAPPKPVPSKIPDDPREAAKAVSLSYICDDLPGIRRKKAGTGFTYISPGGKPVRDEVTLRRIAALAVPPAWTEVWICPDPDGHLQATGRDQRGRKQYRYHPRFREVRDQSKYGRLLAFGRALPAIRRRVKRDLARSGLPREKVLATVIRLLETTFVRVGNEEYARSNGSYGLTTLEDHHAQIRGSKLKLAFRGKSGVNHEIDLEDPRLARIVKQCQELPGQQLLQYVDDHGEVRDIGSGDVNAYIREIAGQDFTAKDFRTWAGSVLAAVALREMGPFKNKAHAKRNIVRAVETVAARLGNTKAVCRKCYIHPEVIEHYLEGEIESGTLSDTAPAAPARAKPAALRADEKLLLELLVKHRAGRAAPASARHPISK